MAKNKAKTEVAKFKFVAKESEKPQTVFCKEGKIVLNEKATQKELQFVYENISNGVQLVMRVPA